jgi:Nif-specific regulatory protein
VLQSGETAIVQDIDDDPHYLARAVERDRLPDETVSFIALPLMSDGEVLGLLGVHRIRGRTRALADDLRILEIIATLVTQVLKLNDRVAEQTARLENENRELKWALERGSPQQATLGIVGESPALRHALRQIEQVARPTPRCCCSASRAPARNCSPARCTCRVRGATSLSSR